MKYLIILMLSLLIVGCGESVKGERKEVVGFEYIKGCLEGKEAIFYWSYRAYREVSFTGRDCIEQEN